MVAWLANGNALRLPLANRSVQCVITSPPYWGLRDYGTGRWVGGDPNCGHKPLPTLGKRGAASSTLDGGHKTNLHAQDCFGQVCLLCGALRVDDQLGLEPTPDDYVNHLLEVGAELWRVLKDDGVLWLNLGDSYCGYWGDSKALEEGRPSAADRSGFVMNNRPKYETLKASGLKPKDLVGIPWMVAFAFRDAGWWLRMDVIWAKGVSGQRDIWKQGYQAARAEGLSEEAARRVADALDPYVGNTMPEGVTDRPTHSHEYLFQLTKAERYYYDAEAIKEPLAKSTRDDKRNSTGRHTQGLNVSKYYDENSPDENRNPDKPSWYRSKVFVDEETGRNRRSP